MYSGIGIIPGTDTGGGSEGGENGIGGGGNQGGQNNSGEVVPPTNREPINNTNKNQYHYWRRNSPRPNYSSIGRRTYCSEFLSK